METPGIPAPAPQLGWWERLVALGPRLARARRAAPWLSLVVGLAGALLMDRSPERAGLVIAAAVGGFAVLAALFLLQRRPEEGGGAVLRASRFLSLAVAQSLAQQSLLFALPFYVRASALDAGQLAFLLALGAVAVAVLWDPAYRAVAARRPLALGIHALSSFTGLNAVLPLLGLSNRAGLLVAALATGAGLPLVAALTAPAGSRRRALLWAAGPALAAPLLLLAGAARVVPPAPLRLVEAAIGTRLEELTAADVRPTYDELPAQLVCATAVAAPRGLKDALVHVWSHDGVEVDRIPVTVRGGREQGFRTWSIKRHLGTSPPGRWECAVETASGQLLGHRVVELLGP